MKTKLALSILSAVAIGLCGTYLTGCASGTTATTASAQTELESIATSPQAQSAFTAATNILGTVATAAIAQAAQKELGSNSTKGNAAASALWTGINQLNSSGAVASLISSIGLPSTAKAVTAAVPNPTPAQVNAVAAVISTVSGAPPAASTITTSAGS